MSFFYLIGVYAFLWWFIDNFKSLFQIGWNLFMSSLQLNGNQPLNEKFGTWAVVTGSTDGIGKEYAKQLAQHGVNVVLIARNQSKLIHVSREIESLFPVQTKYVVADFSNGKEIYENIKYALSTIPVGILVNNVGQMYEYPEELGKVSEDVLYNMILTNVTAVTMMTRLLVNDMKLRKKGIIVNVSSGFALHPAPLASVYAATKVYVKNFTMALQYECEPYGIDVQLLSPYFVRTKLHSYSTSLMAGNFFIPDIETYVRSAIFTLGKTNETTGYWPHAIQFALLKMLPVTLRSIMIGFLNKRLRSEYFLQQQQNRF
ncbi:hydroxysteroid dehydrogenase-like protein 1 isoform X2 [Sitodiplosis mosellana]|uniref:hydroxysteroid dehydrogenase-like protein 1 isoform X2 n=1 Tax=Sitodiplosis mosellana TaxID=263140 RepID=UPI0024451945|nr:hydroxysteroid dehydrogenase-like protein 1 isoform X2 [Sitodiplosis mosellana]